MSDKNLSVPFHHLKARQSRRSSARIAAIGQNQRDLFFWSGGSFNWPQSHVCSWGPLNQPREITEPQSFKRLHMYSIFIEKEMSYLLDVMFDEGGGGPVRVCRRQKEGERRNERQVSVCMWSSRLEEVCNEQRVKVQATWCKKRLNGASQRRRH